MENLRHPWYPKNHTAIAAGTVLQSYMEALTPDGVLILDANITDSANIMSTFEVVKRLARSYGMSGMLLRTWEYEYEEKEKDGVNLAVLRKKK